MSDYEPAIEFRLGVGGQAEQQFAFEQIKFLQARIREFPEKVCRRQSMWAVKKASRWGLLALRTNVARLGHKTGNLMRATTVKTKWYKNAKRGGLPIAVAVIGYRRSGTGDTKKTSGAIRIGNDRAFHAHLVEFGTKRRFPGKSRTVGRIRQDVGGRAQTTVLREKQAVSRPFVVMSSYRTSGPFKASKGQTEPAYPMAFLAKIDPQKGLGAMPAFHPVEHAWKGSQTMMAQSLEEYMQRAIERGMKDILKGRV